MKKSYQPRFAAAPNLPVRRVAFPRQIPLLALLFLGSNLSTHFLFRPSLPATSSVERVAEMQSLYLLEKASPHLSSPRAFGQRVQQIAAQLNIPPAWMMAVMYAESGFDAGVHNHKGSGAVGLIQIMPRTATELGYRAEEIARMNPVEQLEVVHRYFQQVRDRYGEYQSLTDLYLGVLYPKARRQDPCFTLYARPSAAYRMNAGLDENRDGRVTVSDIELRMQRMFPQI
jgi:hypothetical protein